MISLDGICKYLLWPYVSVLFDLKRRIDSGLAVQFHEKSVLIVGTSPQLDFSLIEGNDFDVSIGLHRLHMIYDQTNFRPDILFLGDQALIFNIGSELTSSQDPKTQIVCSSKFWLPYSNPLPVRYIKVRKEKLLADDSTSKEFTNQSFYSVNSVVNLALQLVIVGKPKEIFITGVNFNWEKGYISNEIHNIGLNQPQPLQAKKEFVTLLRIAEDLGIRVHHVSAA